MNVKSLWINPNISHFLNDLKTLLEWSKILVGRSSIYDWWLSMLFVLVWIERAHIRRCTEITRFVLSVSIHHFNEKCPQRIFLTTSKFKLPWKERKNKKQWAQEMITLSPRRPPPPHWWLLLRRICVLCSMPKRATHCRLLGNLRAQQMPDAPNPQTPNTLYKYQYQQQTSPSALFPHGLSIHALPPLLLSHLLNKQQQQHQPCGCAAAQWRRWWRRWGRLRKRIEQWFGLGFWVWVGVGVWEW